MPWIMQMVGFGLLLVGIAVALWLSVWILLFFLAIGIAGVVWSHLREFFIEQGILNPKFASPPEEEGEEQVTIVEGSFTRVENDAEKITKE